MSSWRDEVAVEIDDNVAEVTCIGQQIHTKEGFLAACEMQAELDSGKWKLADDILINTWNGQLEGGYPIQLWQVKGRFVRTNPEPILPVISPVEINLSITPKDKYKANEGLLLHITDPHFGFSRNIDTGELVPYHDREALSVVLQIAQETDFDTVVWGGDIMDFAEWSSNYSKSPEFYWTTKPAVLEAAWWIGKIIESNPKARHIAMAGNHEERLPRAIRDHLPAAYGLQSGDLDIDNSLLSIPSLLGLDKLGVEWVGDYPAQHFIVPDKLCVEHGNTTSKNPGYAAWKIVSESTYSRLYGHGHKRERATKTFPTSDGIGEITAASPGCLCRIDGVVPGHDPVNQHWSQGVGIASYSETGLDNCRIIEIKNGVAKYNEWIKANDVLEIIKKDTNWKF